MAVDTNRLDDAARAGWLYYVAGNTQDQIAAKLGVSRQSAQRLVALAMAEGLVKVRIDHPIAQCLALSRDLTAAFNLSFCEVVPSDPESESTTLGVAIATASELEKWLVKPTPTIIAMGTGRTLKAAVEQLPAIDCPQHKVVSLTGNIAPDGSAAFYNVVFTMADKVHSRSFPMPLPVIASSRHERETLHNQALIQATLALAAQADVAFVGIGDLGRQAPLYIDGFLGENDLAQLHRAGAVGEIVGWAFDANGVLIEAGINERVASAPLPDPKRCMTIAAAMGRKKLPGIAAAIEGRLISGLITDEATAISLLARR
ncbi:MAG TPA: sugar-binding transcriptional regulator [Mesorhizobium sp.]